MVQLALKAFVCTSSCGCQSRSLRLNVLDLQLAVASPPLCIDSSLGEAPLVTRVSDAHLMYSHSQMLFNLTHQAFHLDTHK